MKIIINIYVNSVKKNLIIEVINLIMRKYVNIKQMK